MDEVQTHVRNRTPKKCGFALCVRYRTLQEIEKSLREDLDNVANADDRMI